MNLSIFSSPLPDYLNAAVAVSEAEGLMFTPCTENQMSSFGLDPKEPLTKLAIGYRFNFILAEREISKKALSQSAADEVEAIEKDEERLVLRKERNEIKERILREMVPTAPVVKTKIQAIYHAKKELIFVTKGTEIASSRVMNLLCKLFKAIKTTTLHIAEVNNSISKNLQDHLESDRELRLHNLTVGDKLNLCDGESKANFNGDYVNDHILELLQSGYKVKRLSLKRDGVSFDLTEDFSFKNIKEDESLLTQIEELPKDDIPGRENFQHETLFELLAHIVCDLVDFFNKSADSQKAA